MHRRCDQNRKRSKRRAIYCHIDSCYIHSVSQKYKMFADQAGQLQQRGMSRRNALMLVATQTAVPIEGEWLEAFWSEECQQTTWYHIRKCGDRSYEILVAPQELWEQVTGVIDSLGNPSVGEFTRKSAKQVGYQGLKGCQFVS
ncbi:hypothetical protein [Nostoc sp. PA-18-2419]|uniref:hypothetical protein n=1 Tax=Nostoc sp. PA-18-2419 TaxID=2575443 RepID=UPI0011098446|nr:hypothetical protein [Nostoc sp. PA-18-2419]